MASELTEIKTKLGEGMKAIRIKGEHEITETPINAPLSEGEEEVSEEELIKYREEWVLKKGIEGAEKQKIEKEYIWNVNYDKDGKEKSRKLIHENIAEVLRKKTHFKTIGEHKPEILVYEEGVYKTGGENKIKKQIEYLTDHRAKHHDVNEVVGHIQRQTFCDRDIFIQEPYLICVGNGILNILNLKLEPHSPKIPFTQKIEWDYKPEADCPNIKQFLKEVLKSGDIKIVEEHLGYTLYRGYFVKKALICVGGGNTGKTTFLNLNVAFIGEQNISSVSLHRLLYDKFAGASLYNKLLNIYDDLSFKDINATGEFKIVTGGGYVSAEKKFGDQFQFKNHAKLLFATNKISSVKDTDDEAYFDRWIILFFNNVFDSNNSKTNNHILKELITPEEMSGLLNLAIIGLKRLLKNQKFSYDKTAEENKNIMEKNSNSTSAFIQDCLIENVGGWVSKQDLYTFFCEYLKKEGLGRITIEKFGRSIKAKAPFIQESKKDKTTGWLNVGINQTIHTLYELIFKKKNISFSNCSYGFKKSMNSMKPIQRELSKIETEEADNEAIHYNCFSCGELPSYRFNQKGRPLCRVCFDSQEINK